MLCAYYEKTCRAYTALSANLSKFQHYEFEILTVSQLGFNLNHYLKSTFQDLIEPSKKVAKKVRQESVDQENMDHDEYTQLPAEPEEAVGK